MESAEARAALWTMVGLFVGFKLATTIVIIFAAPYSAGEALWLFVIFHWPFALGGIILLAAPLLFYWRLVRVAARRAQLIEQEWQVEQPRSRLPTGE